VASADGHVSIQLMDGTGQEIDIVTAFLRYLAARSYSPNTLIAYAHDLQHLWRFLALNQLPWNEFRPRHAVQFLEYLRSLSSTHCVRRLTPAAAVTQNGAPAIRLAPTTINRILAAVSSFYEFTIMSEQYGQHNPVEKCPDLATQRVSERHRPFMDGASRQRPLRRRVSVKIVARIPRPLADADVGLLLNQLRSARDIAMIRLMLDGGLRPGEVLTLRLEDVSYGKRRVTIRHRNDHPKGVRAKSRFERVVDLQEPATLSAVSLYVMHERPVESQTPFLFLVGGLGKRRCEPLGYAALAKLFARACERAGIRQAWVTPHCLRHTHATRMWEAGMRELTLQKRLGHASPESTGQYTRISERAVVEDYRRALGLDATSGDTTRPPHA
jgi:integrase